MQYITIIIHNTRILFLIISIIVGIAGTFEVIEDDGTITEEQDMAKALAHSKRFIWHNFVAKWNCANNAPLKKRAQKLGKPLNELRQICQNWQMLALATDAYVKSWECKQQKINAAAADEGPSRLENPLQCLCVKPWLGLEQGQLLLMSSAMEMIKAVHRDLFGWGKGKNLTFEVEFKNLSTWVTVDYWIRLHKNGRENSAEKEILERLLLELNEALGRDPYLGSLEIEPESQSNQKDAQRQFLKHVSRSQNALAPPLTEETFKETLDTGEFHDYVSELNEMYHEFRQQFVEIKDKCVNNRTYEISYSDIRSLNECFKKWWNSVQEIGLDMALMCKKARKYEQENIDRKNVSKILWATKRLSTDLWKKVNKKDRPPLYSMEKNIGIILWLYKHKIQDPFLGKHPDQQHQLEQVPDPCELAKIKVKRTDAMN